MTTSGNDKTPAVEPHDDQGIRLYVNVHPRVFILPTVGAFLGLGTGMIQGARAAQLRYLAENAHNPPRTVQGWYFYNKTKNYRMMWAGLREGAKTGVSFVTYSVYFSSYPLGRQRWARLDCCGVELRKLSFGSLPGWNLSRS